MAHTIKEAEAPRNNMTEATFYWKSNSESAVPDMFACQLEVPFASAENTAKFKMPTVGWTMHGAVARGTIIANIGPQPSCLGLTLARRQHRHRRVVGM